MDARCIRIKKNCGYKNLRIRVDGALERNSNLALAHTPNIFQRVLGTLSKVDDDGYETVVKKYSLLLF